VVTWLSVTTAGTVTNTRASASVLVPGLGPVGPQTLDSAANDSSNPATGRSLGDPIPTIGPSGSADVRIPFVNHGLPEVCTGNEIATRAAGPTGGWTTSAAVDGCVFTLDPPRAVDVAAGRVGDAAYASNASTRSSGLVVGTRVRPAGATSYMNGASVLSGPASPGLPSIRLAPLSAQRYLVVFTRGQDVVAATGRPAGAFEAPSTVASAGTGTQVAGLASSEREAVAAWRSGGQLLVAFYDDAATPTPGAPPPAATKRDTIAPVLTRLSVSPRRFAPRRSNQARVRAAAARSTRIRWRLSEPARVFLRFDRVRSGFRRGHRCVARRPRSGRIRHCSRFVRVGSFSRTAAAGITSLRFRGRIGRHVLPVGGYRLTATARDLRATPRGPSTPGSASSGAEREHIWRVPG
jgi:hypothetical protein